MRNSGPARFFVPLGIILIVVGIILLSLNTGSYEQTVGKVIADITVEHMDMLEKYFDELNIDIAILTLPKEFAASAAQRLVNTGVKGIWNFTGKELELGESGIVVENVHIGDSLMTLCYEIAVNDSDGE